MTAMNHPQDPSPACHAFRLAADAALADPSIDGWSADPHPQQCTACARWMRLFAAYRVRLRQLGDAFVAPDGLRARVAALLRRERDAGTP